MVIHSENPNIKQLFPLVSASLQHHTFHIENFLLRLTSVIDRSYLLAGSTMLMENSKIERLGGNRNVHKELSTFSPRTLDILKSMEDAVNT